MPSSLDPLIPLAIAAVAAAVLTWWWLSRRTPHRDVLNVIDTLIENGARELGVRPDAASVVFFSRRPSLCKKLWHLLGEGGSANQPLGRPLSPEAEEQARTLLDLVHNERMRTQYPAAHALIQYTAFLTLPPVQGRLLVEHPNPEFRS